MNFDAVDGIQDAWARELPDMPGDSIGVVSRILRIAKLLTDERRRVLSRLAVDNATLDLIATLRRSGEPYRLAPTEIAQDCLVSGGAITQRVARAEQAGLVRTERTESGRRTVAVVLTQRGHEVIEHSISELINRERELIASLDAGEREQLSYLLRKALASVGDNVATQSAATVDRQPPAR